MLSSILELSRQSWTQERVLGGLQLLYHPGELNRCPGCGRTNWYVGRTLAECGFCGTAMALADTGLTGIGMVDRPRHRLDDAA
jgi:hypothetical protein